MASCWTNELELVLKFIELYQAEPVLWNPRNYSQHKNRNAVIDAWQYIEVQMQCSPSFLVNELIWADISDTSQWPGIVVDPDCSTPPKPKENMQWIYFFGSHTYDWVEVDQIVPFSDRQHEFINLTTKPVKYIFEEVDNIIGPFEDSSCLKANIISKEIEEFIESSEESLDESVSELSSLTEKSSSSISAQFIAISNDPGENVDQIQVCDGDNFIFKVHDVPDKSKKNQSKRCPMTPKDEGVGDQKNDLNTSKRIGILAGNHSRAKDLIKDLMYSGYELCIWSPMKEFCKELQTYLQKYKGFCKMCSSPTEVVTRTDVIFSCLENADHVKNMLTNFGIVNPHDDFLNGKGYIEMTNIDFEDSKYWYAKLHEKKATYLEAMVQGSKSDPYLLFLLAGDECLFKECEDIFTTLGKVFFFQKIGLANKLHLIFQVMKGTFLAGLSECFSFINIITDVEMSQLYEVFKASDMSSNYLNRATKHIIENNFNVEENSLDEVHANCHRVIEMSHEMNLPLPFATSLNHIFQRTRRLELGLENKDVSSIYTRIRY